MASPNAASTPHGKYSGKTRGEKLRSAAQNLEVRHVCNLLKDDSEPLDVNDADSFGNTALMHVAAKGSIEMAEELLKHKANINAKDKYGQTALFFAVSNGHTEMVQLLIEAGASTNDVTVFGQTVIMKAAYTISIYSASIVQILLEQQAHTDVQGEVRASPFHCLWLVTRVAWFTLRFGLSLCSLKYLF